MIKRFLAMTTTLCMLFLLFPATVVAVEAEAEEPVASEPNVLSVVVDDQIIDLDVPALLENGVSYLPCLSVVRAFYPEATEVTEEGVTSILAPGLKLELTVDQPYVVANGRYLYLPQGYRYSEDSPLLPTRTLGAILGADVAWDPVGFGVVMTTGSTGLITPAEEAYDETQLYWLSHIINAESGNQPLAGKIAVGNVVLNRVASSIFPDTIKGVLFQKNQFTPAATGSIYKEPNDESVIAAKLCLDGANTVGNALFFHNPRTAPNCWAARNRTYLTTIGNHAFYG